MTMYNYCTKCGDELNEEEHDVVYETDAAPLCLSCAGEVLMELSEALAFIEPDLAKTVGYAFGPVLNARDNGGDADE